MIVRIFTAEMHLCKRTVDRVLGTRIGTRAEAEIFQKRPLILRDLHVKMHAPVSEVQNHVHIPPFRFLLA